MGCRRVEQDRVVDRFGRRNDDVAETDVDLERHPRSGQARSQADADPVVLVRAADLLAPDRPRVELEAVFAGYLAHLPKDLLHPGHSRIPESQQVEVSGGAVALAAPACEEQGTLQDEGVRVGRLGQSVQEALDRVPREDELKVLTPLSCPVQEPLANGCGQVPLLPRTQTSASR